MRAGKPNQSVARYQASRSEFCIGCKRAYAISNPSFWFGSSSVGSRHLVFLVINLFRYTLFFFLPSFFLSLLKSHFPTKSKIALALVIA